jgi:hypothetical protein
MMLVPFDLVGAIVRPWRCRSSTPSSSCCSCGCADLPDIGAMHRDLKWSSHVINVVPSSPGEFRCNQLQIGKLRGDLTDPSAWFSAPDLPPNSAARLNCSNRAARRSRSGRYGLPLGGRIKAPAHAFRLCSSSGPSGSISNRSDTCTRPSQPTTKVGMMA